MAATENLPTVVLDAVKRGEDAALDAVRKCANSIEELVGAGGDDGSVVRRATDSVFELVDRIMAIQHDLVRSLVGLATETVKQVAEPAPTPTPPSRPKVAAS
jgi:hypothetical protein